MIESIKLFPIQASPIDIVSSKKSFEVIEINLNAISEKINELILILNNDNISEKKRAGRPKKEIDNYDNG